MRSLLRTLLNSLADTIFECADGSEALELYRRYRPDFVLMDIKMEAVDGIEATRQIVGAFPAARVIIVTDYDDTELRDAAKDAGACDFVSKENLLDLGQVLAQSIHPKHLTAS